MLINLKKMLKLFKNKEVLKINLYNYFFIINLLLKEMNCQRAKYTTFKNYWQPPSPYEKENFFVNYDIRGPATISLIDSENLKMCGI